MITLLAPHFSMWQIQAGGGPTASGGRQEGSLDLVAGTFDAVVAHALLSHVDDPSAAIGEAARVVRSGGMVAIFDCDFASLTFSHPDPAQGKAYDEAVSNAIATSPRVMRQMPRLLKAAELELVTSFAYVVTAFVSADARSPRSPTKKSSERRAVCTFVVASNHTEVRDAQEGGLHGDSSTGEARRLPADIAEQLGVHPKTVQPGAEARAAPRRGRGGRRGSQLDPYRPASIELLAEGVWNAVVILREIQALGYAGGDLDAARLHPRPSGRCGRAGRRCASRPSRAGSCRATGAIQRDADRRRRPSTVHFIVNTLGLLAPLPLLGTDSRGRRAHLRRADPGLRVLRRRDRARCWSTTRRRRCSRIGAGGAVRFNARFVDLAGHYGFTPAGLPAGSGADQGQGRAHGRLRQAPLLRPLPRLRELGASEPAGRAVAARGSRPARARHGPRGGGRALRARGAARCGRCRPGATTPPTGSRARSAGTATSTCAAIATACPPRWPASRSRSASRSTAQLRGLRRRAASSPQHRLQPAERRAGSPCPSTTPRSGRETLDVERRPLAVYEEAATWN